MTLFTLKNLSREMNITVIDLIEKFSNIGISKEENDYVNLYEKKLLLHYLSSKNELSLNIHVNENSHHSFSEKKINSLKKTNINLNNNDKNLIKKDVFLKKDSLNSTNDINTIYNKKTESIILKKKYLKNMNSEKNIVYEKKTVDIPSSIYFKNKKKDHVIKNKNHYKKNFHINKKVKINIINDSIKKKSLYNSSLNNNINLHKYEDINNVSEYQSDRYIQNNKVKNSQKVNENNIKKKKHDKKFFLHKNKNYSLLTNFIKPKKKLIREVIIHDMISIQDLANKMAIKGSEIIKRIKNIIDVTDVHQVIDQTTAQLIIEEMGHKAILQYENSLERFIINQNKISRKKYNSVHRSPIVTIMGHVDHGKTSLLDYIRSTKVAKNEFGGITQHIGAYCVNTKKGKITFLDTPGHSAFTKMRARGAQITDIIVLVVAGDDGVKPQTIEAIQHAKSAGVPLLVAINKIDKIESNSEKVKKELMNYEVIPEEWGGETIFVNISAITGTGIDNLLSAILLQAEVLELKSTVSGMAMGVVIESYLDKYRGPTATILVQEGKLRKGDNVLCGTTYGKIRVIIDSYNDEKKEIGPSIPVKILGLSDAPTSGDIFHVVKNEKDAREVALYRKNKIKNNQFEKMKKNSLNDIFNRIKNQSIKECNIILKTDVKGSLEAISNAIVAIQNKEVNIKILYSNVGNITETDVNFAISTKSMILGFNVQTNITAKKLIKKEKVDVRFYSVIYTLIDDIKLLIKGLISPQHQTIVIGSAEVRDKFQLTKSTVIVGCMVVNGSIKKNNAVRILRKKNIIYTGEIGSLRRFKDDVKLVGTGKECGIGIKNYNDICVGDVIESFEVIEVKK
ncbi:translation initiation factor IF-2 [Buchnera aphidicola]|uniref:translation initiation factor IF-2 n=1 Tax=Buchnera aphidicola TaxID=9 RepID=UPI0031B8A5E1